MVRFGRFSLIFWQVIRDPTTGEIVDICEVEDIDVTQKKIKRGDENDSDSELDELLNVPTLSDLDFETGMYYCR